MLRRNFFGVIATPLLCSGAVSNSVVPLTEEQKTNVLLTALLELQVTSNPDRMMWEDYKNECAEFDLEYHDDEVKLLGFKCLEKHNLHIRIDYPVSLKFVGNTATLDTAYDMFMEGKYKIIQNPGVLSLALNKTALNKNV